MEFSHARPSKLNPIFGQFAQNPAEADASDSFISYFLNPVYKNEIESRCNYNLGWNLILPVEFNFTKWNLKFQLTKGARRGAVLPAGAGITARSRS